MQKNVECMIRKIKYMNNENKDISPITVTICRDMFRYDANEIVQQAADVRTEDNKGYNSDYAD